MKEIWKDVVGYEGIYEVSNIGNVRSLDRYVYGKLDSKHFVKGKVFKLQKSHKGYRTVILHKCGKAKQKQVHRLVAEAFISNPLNFPQVNHKDTNKENNCVNNLEWITNYGNMQHAVKNGCFGKFTDRQKEAVMENLKKCHKARKKRVIQTDDFGNVIAEYESATQAERGLGIGGSKIIMCCKGKRKHAGGFCWKYGKGEFGHE